MASIQEITQGASYQGNAALGGAIDFGITIDPSPMQRLATFAYYRDRDLWEKKNADDKIAAQQVANIAAFDINSPLKPFAEDLKKELADIQSFVRENPDALVYSRNPDKFQELSERINRFSNKRKGATANDVLYNAAKSKIETIPDPRERDIKLRELDIKVGKLFEPGIETAYNTQLEGSPEIKQSDFQIPVAGQTVRSFIMQLPNSDITTEITYTDLDDLRAKSEILAAGGGEQVDVNSAWFKRLSPAEQQIELEKGALTSTKRAKLQELSATFTNALGQWKQANPNIDLTAVDPATLGGGILEDNIRSVKSVNDQIDQLNSLVLEGKITDPSGRVRTKPYDKINFEDGLSEAELIMMKSIQESKSPLLAKIDKKIAQTDNAIQEENMRTQRALGWANLNWDKEKFKLSLKGPEETKSAALIFAENLVSDIASKGSLNGANGAKVLTRDDLRKLTSEQLKWLGSELPAKRDENGTVIQSAGVQPLSLSGDEFLQINPNGEILVMSGANLNKEGTKFGGKWDNKRSTTIGNVARLVLNEENAKSGNNEVNNYVPIDLGKRTNQVYVTQSGGGTTVSGSTSTRGGGKSAFNIIDPRSGKVVMSGVSKEQADKAAAKGYTIQ